jgi:hypothetical protein
MEHKHLETKKYPRFFLAVFTAFALLFSLSSCLKDNDDDEVGVSFITFTNSLPQFPSLDFYIAGGKATPQPLLFTENSGLYESNPPYGGLYSNTYYIQVAADGKQILGLPGTLEPYANYSFFVATSSATSDTIVPVVFKDDMTAPSGGKAKVRFINLIRNTSAYDLSAQGGSSVMFNNKAYKTQGNFMEVTPGDYVYELKDAGTATVRATKALKVDANKIYTLWASGGNSSATTTVDPKLNVIVNK